MSILGKVLIVFNLLAAGAFAYFTLENWKVRKGLTNAALVRDIQLYGIPVEPGSAKPDDPDDTAFGRDLNAQPHPFIPKKVMTEALPKGGDTLGGAEAVYTQTDEVLRVQKKVAANIPPLPDKDHFNWLKAYLVAVATSGQDRDGANAIFDLRDPSRAYAARRDLPLAARTEAQTAALKALVEVADLGDPQAIPEAFRGTRITQARDAIKRFATGEVPRGATDDEGRRKLNNAVLSALQDRAGQAQVDAVSAAAPADPNGFKLLAAAAIETLADKASADRAATALLGYATSKAITPAETPALTAIGSLIRGTVLPAPPGFNLDAQVDAAATNLLNAKFEEAALPASGKSGAGGDPLGEKARKIAHLLYNIDGWRYADPKSADDRKAWHSRVATVVGLTEYVRAAETEATEYKDAAERLQSVITEEQSAFEAAYQAKLQRVQFLYSQFLALDQQLKAQQAITAENQRLMDERKTERDKLLEDLAKAREDAKAALANLTKTQKDLFAIQKQLRDAQEALFVLHDQLRELEAKAGAKDQAASK